MTLSIITINLNNADGLERTLASVARQLPAEISVEHVIIDGASADGSVERIRAYANVDHPYKVVWVSEPDKGIYNAMNKGIRMAEGDYIQVLNSGDYLAKLSDDQLLQRNPLHLATKLCEKGLRYDLTVPFARYVVQHRDEIQLPFKRYQIQPVWRADRPQRAVIANSTSAMPTLLVLTRCSTRWS